MAVVPRNASTLILLRDAAGLEVLMLRRHSGSAFLPGAHVFPGGAVEVSDCAPEVEELCEGMDFEGAGRVIGDVTPPDLSLGFFVAAIREAFEEAGILLAYDVAARKMVSTDRQASDIAAARQALHSDSRFFVEMIRQSQMKLATDRLFYFAHWITPELSPIRFDARFFVAAAPDEQQVQHDAFETTEGIWRQPLQLLHDHNERTLYLPVPTLSCVEELAQYRTVDEAIASTRGKKVYLRRG